MTPEFFQDYQDDRTWCLEQLKRKEGHLETRMYACADHALTEGISKDLKELNTLWERWKNSTPDPNTQINRL